MLRITDVRGVVFDVDDTLLSNYPPHIPLGLHEHSRLRAAHVVGKRHGIRGLQELTIEQAHQAFRDSPVHTLHGAIWQTLKMIGEVQGKIDFTHPLLREMVKLKDELHEETLRTHGREVPGAVQFVQSLAEEHGLADKMAVASTACRRDIIVFFNEMTDLHRFFPEHRIISREQFTHPKPHPEVFELALKSLGLRDRSNMLAFEDDPRGVMSAKAAGLHTCAITTRYSREEFAKLMVSPDLIADSYDEFREHLGMSKAVAPQ